MGVGAKPNDLAYVHEAVNLIERAEKRTRKVLTSISNAEKLSRDGRMWNQIVVALDVVGDTTEAVRAYVDEYPEQAQFGSKYLVAYGLLQALFIQQDATCHVAEALGLSCKSRSAPRSRS